MRRKKVNTIGLLDVKRTITEGEYIFWSSDMAINLKADAQTLTQSLLVPHIPYCLAENRIILVKGGKLRFLLDLIEHQASAGDMAFIPKDSIVEIKEVSADYQCQMITFPEIANNDDIVDLTTPIILQNHYSAHTICNGLIMTLFSIQSSDDGHALSSLIILKALVKYIKECSFTSTTERSTTQKRAEQIHNKFIRLVRENYATHRDTGWYADKLCISRHYLHNCVSTVSGKSVQQWISLAVIQRTRYLLKYTDLSIYEIASQLGFTTHAFFTRYFKQKTGVTPEAYRKDI